MSGNKAKPRPSAVLGIASLMIPILGFGIGWSIIASTQQTSSFKVVPDGFEWMMVSVAIASIIGMIVSIRSLREHERWPLIAAVGLLVNGVALAYTFPFSFLLLIGVIR